MNGKLSLLPGLAGACLALLALAAPSARAQVITVDELGTPDPHAPSTIATDPTLVPPGPPTVAYILPFPVIPGDVQIFEPPATTNGQPSDLLRFVQNGNNGVLLIYSDVSAVDPGNAPADVGLPPNLQANVLPTVETGLGGLPYTESSNGLFYTPGPGNPGLPLGAAGGVSYNFISDSPEPGMLCLIPAVASLLMRNRRRTTIA